MPKQMFVEWNLYRLEIATYMLPSGVVVVMELWKYQSTTQLNLLFNYNEFKKFGTSLQFQKFQELTWIYLKSKHWTVTK